MKKLLLIFVVIFLLSKESIESLPNQFVFKFKTENINKEETSCLMFVSDNPNIGYTAYHCLSDQVKCYNLKLTQNNKSICKKILYQNPDKDLTIFELKEFLSIGPSFVLSNFKDVKFSVFKHKNINQNFCIYHEKNDGNQKAQMMDAYNNPKNYKFNTAKCESIYGLGDSGSPVVTEQGIIGIAFAHNEFIENEVSWIPLSPEDVKLDCNNNKLLINGRFFCN